MLFEIYIFFELFSYLSEGCIQRGDFFLHIVVLNIRLHGDFMLFFALFTCATCDVVASVLFRACLLSSSRWSTWRSRFVLQFDRKISSTRTAIIKAECAFRWVTIGQGIVIKNETILLLGLFVYRARRRIAGRLLHRSSNFSFTHIYITSICISTRSWW